MRSAEDRIALAKDALANLHLLYPTRNYYLQSSFDYGVKHLPLVELLSRPDERCRVCAIGTLFVTMLLKDSDSMGCSLDVDLDMPREDMIEFFGVEQTALIETAFEGIDVTTFYFNPSKRTDQQKLLMDLALSHAQRELGIKHSSDYPDPTDSALLGTLLQHIFRNIIANEGTFIP